MANSRTTELGHRSLLLYGNGNAGVLALLLIYFIKIVLWPNTLMAAVHMKVLYGHTIPVAKTLSQGRQKISRSIINPYPFEE
jgi:hypothetical protein